jgi:hypothetical protein
VVPTGREPEVLLFGLQRLRPEDLLNSNRSKILFNIFRILFLEGQFEEVSPTRVQREYLEQGSPNPGLSFSFFFILLFTIKSAQKSQVMIKIKIYGKHMKGASGKQNKQ